MTIGEFQKQCELYPYSIERFELLKECKEVELESVYIEQLRFVNENKSVIDPSTNYLIEASEEVYDKIFTEHKYRAGNIFTRIIGAICRLLRSAANFFHKLSGNASKQFKEADFVYKSLNKLSGDDPKWDSIIDIVKTAKNKLNRTCYAFSDGIGRAKFQWNVPIKKLHTDDVININFALSKDVIRFYPGDHVDIITPEFVTKLRKIFDMPADRLEPYIQDILGNMTNQGRVFKIDFSAETFVKIGEELQEIAENIASLQNNDDGKNSSALNELYTKLNTVIANTISVYNSINTYRKEVTFGISKLFRSESAPIITSPNITSAFTDAVKDNNVRLIRIMMKDSLLLDPSFKQFDEMNRLAKDVPGLYDEHDGRELDEDPSHWNDDYMNELMVQVISNFSHERVELLKKVVAHLKTK